MKLTRQTSDAVTSVGWHTVGVQDVVMNVGWHTVGV